MTSPLDEALHALHERVQPEPPEPLRMPSPEDLIASICADDDEEK